MKTLFQAADGTLWSKPEDCVTHEMRTSKKKTYYAKTLETLPAIKLVSDARTYAKWLREKQDYPATDSGEHHCCDLLIEMADRFERGQLS